MKGKDTEPRAEDARIAGLCAGCAHCRRLSSDRGSLFYLCRRSETDAAFPKYPKLPVTFCRGHEPAPVGTGEED